MQINEIYNAVLHELNKDQSGDAFTIDEFNNRLKTVDMDMIKIKLGLPEDYQPGRPIARQGHGITAILEDQLQHLKTHKGESSPGVALDAHGKGALPTDYLAMSTVYTNHGDLIMVNDDDWSGRLNSKLRKPTIKRAIGRVINGSIEVRPKTLTMLYMTYFRKPTPAFFDYNIVNDEEVYLPAGSTHDGSNLTAGTASRTTQLDWPDHMHTDIINLLVGYGAKNLDDQLGIQGAESRKIRGQ